MVVSIDCFAKAKQTKISGQASSSSEITQLLRRWQGGDAQAREHLVEAVYHQVRAIAQKALRGAVGATLTPTELAHEALLRLLGAEASWEDRKHFYNVIAQATRQVLVDAARRRARQKHGENAPSLSLSAAADVAIDAQREDAMLLNLNNALELFSKADPRRAQVIELSYFAGLDRAQTAELLDCSLATVDRDLRFGKAWLKNALEQAF
jgi:RNA polymerase sigma-70 factor, ECF subfamily